MARLLLTDEEWELIAEFFPQPKATGRKPRNQRTVLDGILWVLRTGAPWRDLPEEFGPWQTAWRLFDDWNSQGIFERILEQLRTKFVQLKLLDSQLWCIDGTITRAHRCAGGGGKKTTGVSQLITR